ncbi:MAG: hypothetical protein IPK19_33230 [Chloroflexi bacterium]|nr:hypothetical protein [Chloroflexota bacterium]
MLFTLLPLLQVSVIYLIQYRISQMSMPVDGGAGQSVPFAVGGSSEGVTDAGLIIQVVLGLAYVPLALMAWRGRPRSIRLIIMGFVVALTAITVVLMVANLTSSPSIQSGIDSGGDLARQLTIGRTVLSALIALYVVWYLNRGPARAFFRGHYLTEPELGA